MTINLSDNSPRESYTVSQGATQTTFAVPFEFFDDADLNVYVDGTLKTITTHYTVSGGSGSTGSVAISVTGISGGSTVIITRDIALARTTDFPTSGPFDVATLNTELDRFTAQLADQKDQNDRSISLADDDAAASMTLPDKADRIGKTLAFNASTGAVEAGPSVAGVTTVNAMAADIAALADIEDGTIATDAISGLAAIKTDVTAVANIATAVSAVNSNATNINAVNSNSSNINTVAGKSSEITSVAAKASLLTSDFVSDLNTLAVTDVINDINLLATSDIVSDLNTLATTDIVSDLNTLATTDIVSDINTLATSDIVTDLNLLATSDFVSDLNTLATSGNVTALNNVSGAIANVNTVASNLTNVNSFADTYFVSGTAPSSPTSGDLWFDSSSDTMKVYGSSGFQNAGSSVNGTSQRVSYTATAGQTSFAATYDAGFVDVYLNGIKLISGTDFTATNGTAVVLASGAAVNDTVDIVAYGTFSISNFSVGDANDVSVAGASSGDVLTYNGSAFAPSAPTVPTLSSLGIANHNNVTVDASGNISVSGNLTVTGTSTGKFTGIQTFTADGTYTPTTGTTKVLVQLVGGGGAGGGVDGQGSSSDGKVAAGGGGGGGGCAIAFVTSLGATETVTVGAGGTGVAGANTGGNGGTTSFGSHAVATGGNGGGQSTANTPTNARMAYGGTAGGGTTGDITFTGTAGGYGVAAGTSSSEVASGMGGSSFFGGGERGRSADNNGFDGRNYGGGGSGGSVNNVATNYRGGHGQSGIVVIYEYQ